MIQSIKKWLEDRKEKLANQKLRDYVDNYRGKIPLQLKCKYCPNMFDGSSQEYQGSIQINPDSRTLHTFICDSCAIVRNRKQSFLKWYFKPTIKKVNRKKFFEKLKERREKLSHTKITDFPHKPAPFVLTLSGKGAKIEVDKKTPYVHQINV